MKRYIKSSAQSDIQTIIDNSNSTPSRLKCLKLIDWQISPEDADKLINGRSRAQYMALDKPIVRVSYPNEAQKKKSEAKGAIQSFVFTLYDDRELLYGYIKDDDSWGYESLEYLGRG